MVDPILKNWINDALAKGYSKEYIRDYLIKYGYPVELVDEALQKKPAKKINMGLMIAVVVAALFVSGVVIAYITLTETTFEETQPIIEEVAQQIPSLCGECQYLENGECLDFECCNDNDCSDNERCVQNTCERIICGGCQYLSERVCVDYECCLDSDCVGGFRCENNLCLKVFCEGCEYLEGSECKPYECCLDVDCDDGIVETLDLCVNASTTESECKNIVPDECNEDVECDDQDISTKDECIGEPKVCLNVKIVECISWDGFCPEGCDSSDNDCEQIDECSEDFECDDGNEFTIDACIGDPSVCVNLPSTVCTSGDGRCPTGCKSDFDNDCE